MKKIWLWIIGGVILLWLLLRKSSSGLVNPDGSTPYPSPTGNAETATTGLPASFLSGLANNPALQPYLGGISTYLSNPTTASGPLSIGALTQAGASLLNSTKSAFGLGSGGSPGNGAYNGNPASGATTNGETGYDVPVYDEEGDVPDEGQNILAATPATQNFPGGNAITNISPETVDRFGSIYDENGDTISLQNYNGPDYPGPLSGVYTTGPDSTGSISQAPISYDAALYAEPADNSALEVFTADQSDN